MFKLVVLSALLAVAAARPGLIESPVVYSAPATTIVHEPAYAKVGAVVKSIPTAVSHQSQSVIHSSAHVVEDIVAPVVKTVYTAPVVKTIAAAPVLHTNYIASPVLKTYAAPVVHSVPLVQSAPVIKAIAAPALTTAYAGPALSLHGGWGHGGWAHGGWGHSGHGW
ncbi:cuticle protein 12.5-like [Teleopsis dalmanni]|uniref:cuticle protein 12.5-like n=1 Tax=Teleopsis dalmanni TaxID=139649 RepID=UPI0018CF9C85|nr:cuticle protein 12.5-like [Teleopsis dalmanni]